MKLQKFLDNQAKSPRFQNAYRNAQTRSDLLAALIAARKTARLTQKQVAKAMETTQSAVSEFESGSTDPRLSTLQRYASSLGLTLEVELKPEAVSNVHATQTLAFGYSNLIVSSGSDRPSELYRSPRICRSIDAPKAITLEPVPLTPHV